MKYPERVLRDTLAADPDRLEAGLNLVDKELYIPGGEVARGFVDLVFRDRSHQLVLVEIKVSPKTSRETIQELLKYATGVRRQFGVQEKDLRLVVVSTDWRELLAPFHELKQQCPYDVMGYRAILGADGRLSRLEPIPDRDAAHPLRSVTANAFFFDTRKAADSFQSTLGAFVRDIKLDCLICLLKRKRHMFNDWCVYVAPSDLPASERKSLVKKEGLRSRFTAAELREPQLAEVMAITDFVLKNLTYDDFEGGSPTKFDAILAKFDLVRIDRFGRYDTLIHDTASVVGILTGLATDTNAWHTKFLVNIRHSKALAARTREARNGLRYGRLWKRLLTHVLRELRKLDGLFYFESFEPRNIPLALFITSRGERGGMPMMWMLLHDETTATQRLFHGYLAAVPETESLWDSFERAHASIGINENTIEAIVFSSNFFDYDAVNESIGPALGYDFVVSETELYADGTRRQYTWTEERGRLRKSEAARALPLEVQLAAPSPNRQVLFGALAPYVLVRP